MGRLSTTECTYLPTYLQSREIVIQQRKLAVTTDLGKDS